MTDLERAKAALHRENYTCVFCDDRRILTDKRHGIAPLLARLDDEEELRGMSVADKIIGKAAALLLIHCGVAEVYGEIMSTDAQALLAQNGIAAHCGKSVSVILNRDGSAPCPMEQAVGTLTDPAAALAAIRTALAK